MPDDVLHFDTPFVTDIAHNADPSPAGHRQQPGDSSGHSRSRTPTTPRPRTSRPSRRAPTTTRCSTRTSPAVTARCNENIALSAIHQVFHSEHDRLVAQIEDVLTHDTSGATTLSDWQLPGRRSEPDRTAGTVSGSSRPPASSTRWSTSTWCSASSRARWRRASRRSTATHPDVNPAIHDEFAQAVYRFGHSMLDEDVARKTEDPGHGRRQGRLDPAAHRVPEPAGVLRRRRDRHPHPRAGGGQRDHGLLGPGRQRDRRVRHRDPAQQPARPADGPGRDQHRARPGVRDPAAERRARADLRPHQRPSMAPYASWAEFGQHLKHPESLVNFVAAYGKHPTILDATTLAAKRAAARAIVDPGPATCRRPTPRTSCSATVTGTSAAAQTNTGIEDVDLWVGGLAEATNLNGGLLGSTFNYVFENQLADLQDGDRLYYLNRTPGMNLLSQLEGNSFAEMIERNTDGTHSLKADAFSTVDCRFELAHLDGTPARLRALRPGRGGRPHDDRLQRAPAAAAQARRDDRLPRDQHRRPERRQRAGRLRRHAGRSTGSPAAPTTTPSGAARATTSSRGTAATTSCSPVTATTSSPTRTAPTSSRAARATTPSTAVPASTTCSAATDSDVINGGAGGNVSLRRSGHRLRQRRLRDRHRPGRRRRRLDPGRRGDGHPGR